MVKKGYIVTIEAVIAILLILIFIFTVLPRPVKQQPEPNINLVQKIIINEIENREMFRAAVLQDSPVIVEINTFIKNNLDRQFGTNRFDFNLVIQDITDEATVQFVVFQIPSNLPSDKSVFAESTFITANNTKYSPKLVTLYIWQT